LLNGLIVSGAIGFDRSRFFVGWGLGFAPFVGFGVAAQMLLSDVGFNVFHLHSKRPQ
jgi:hypothetical protein